MKTAKPNFKAWEKLGWICFDTHANTYSFCHPDDCDFDFEVIYIDLSDDDKNCPCAIKERQSVYDGCQLLEFTDEEKIQLNKDFENYYKVTYEDVLNRVFIVFSEIYDMKWDESKDSCNYKSFEMFSRDCEIIKKLEEIIEKAEKYDELMEEN